MTGGAARPVRTLAFWCFSPGVAVKELAAARVRSIVLTSGTLAPLNSFAQEMKTPFKVQLENPHVVSAEQVWIGVVTRGPSGNVLNSSYKNRSNVAYVNDLGATIANVARIVPDGVLVFFPSYTVMQKCVGVWQTKMPNASSCMWDTIARHKTPFTEPRGASGDLQVAMDEFYRTIRTTSGKDNPGAGGSGAIFFAVCRGKVSEGLDFADANGRAVIVTGLPYPNLQNPKVKLKRRFLDEKRAAGTGRLSGNLWYTQQASRAVNQAIGRVIRHKDDYGAILLCDERFGRNDNVQQLPIWLRSSVKICRTFGEANRGLLSFFKIIQNHPCFQASLDRAAAKQAARDEASASRSAAAGTYVVRDQKLGGLSAPPGPDEIMPGVSKRRAPYVGLRFGQTRKAVSIPPPPSTSLSTAGCVPVPSGMGGVVGSAQQIADPKGGARSVARKRGGLSSRLGGKMPQKRRHSGSTLRLEEDSQGSEAVEAKHVPLSVRLQQGKQGGAGAGSSSGEDMAAQTAKFLRLAKEKLSKSEYKAMRKALKTFVANKSSEMVEQLIEVMWAMFSLPGREELLSTFAVFIPPNHQIAYIQRVESALFGRPGAAKRVKR